MNALDLLLPTARLIELDHVDLAATPERVWERIRRGDLFVSPFVRALFAARALPERLRGETPAPLAMHLDDLVSSPERPGFQILVDDPPREVALGAIGKVWQGEIPFVHVANARAYAAFDVSDFVKVAWALRVVPRGERDARVEIEVRVDATDEAAWQKFKRYFLLIGPGSHFIRRVTLFALEREFGAPEEREVGRPLSGDELLPDAAGEVTRSITIAATPEVIWPWLVQMGCRRGGFYSYDLLDNGGERSAREIHPELQRLAVGDVIPAAPEGDDGFEVLRLDAPRTLILGGLYDVDAKRQLRFAAPRPEHYWHVTWTFALEAIDDLSTRLHVRARAAFSPDERLHFEWIRPVHHLMQAAQLRHLAARAEGRLPPDDWRDLIEGVGGVAIMALAWITPFLRSRREHWGLDPEIAAIPRTGDSLVPEARWSWTHGVEIDASAAEVWPWIAQLGADRGGFYSYQAIENLAGCELHNAEAIHPEWALREGDALVLHPEVPPLWVVSLVRGRHLLAFSAPDTHARAAGRPWVTASWLFQLEPLGASRCRLVSRYRCACSDDLATRATSGPGLLEPVGFTMDRRMLLGVKARAEAVRHSAVRLLTPPTSETRAASTDAP